MKRRVDGSADSGQVTMVVSGRYLRVSTDSLPEGASSSWARKAAPRNEALEVSELGFTAASEWATTRILSGRLTPQAVKDRALLMVSDAQCRELLDAATSLALQAPLPASLGSGCLAENVFVAGNATARTLCVGDVLAVVETPKRHRRKATASGSGDASGSSGCGDASGSSGGGDASLRLQVSSPCQPCSKVDQRLGRTWGGRGVRAHAARTGSRGWFVRVLRPGIT